MKNIIFEARELIKSYKTGEFEFQALKGINLDLYEGEFVVMLGASGSGKSTLLNILGGLDSPSSGYIRFKDHDLINSNDTQMTQFRREHIGFVFQFYNLIPTLTALENVELVSKLTPEPLDPKESLALVGLSERMHHYPSQLSGGEQQRVAIARALVKNPDVLLCDEPTGALDFKTGKIVLEALEHVHKVLGRTVVIITHNVSIASIADRVIYISDGRIKNIEVNSIKKNVNEISW